MLFYHYNLSTQYKIRYAQGTKNTKITLNFVQTCQLAKMFLKKRLTEKTEKAGKRQIEIERKEKTFLFERCPLNRI